MLSIAVNTLGTDRRPAGIRALFYLAELLAKLGHQVQALPNGARPADANAIVVYPDGAPGNPWGANRIVRYMLYYPHVYYGPSRIPASELCIAWHPLHYEAVQSQYDGFVPPPITIPIIEPGLFYPERKTIQNLIYLGNKQHANGNPHLFNAVIVTRGSHSRPQFAGLMRRAHSFYSTDHDSATLAEAKLCGCETFIVHGPSHFEKVDRAVDGLVMNQARDLALAERFAFYIQSFFGL